MNGTNDGLFFRRVALWFSNFYLLLLLLLLIFGPTARCQPAHAADYQDRHAFKGSWNQSTETDFVTHNYKWTIGNSVGTSRYSNWLTSCGTGWGNTCYFIQYSKVAGLADPTRSAGDDAFGWNDYTDYLGNPKQGVVTQNLFWYDGDGNKIRNTENNWYYIDILDDDKRAAWITILLDKIHALNQLHELSGVFLDNSSVLLSSFVMPGYGTGYTDADYYAAVEDILTAVRAEFPDPFLIIANSYAGWAAEGNRGLEFAPLVNCLAAETWSFKTDGSFYTPGRIRQNIHDARVFTYQPLNSGRCWVPINYFTSTDYRRRIFAAAMYYFTNDTGTTSYGRQVEYSIVTDTSSAADFLPEYDITIGIPQATSDDEALITRGFSGGYVALNPESRTHVLTIPEIRGTGDKFIQMGLQGGTAWNDATARVTWNAVIPPTMAMGDHTGLILKRIANGAPTAEISATPSTCEAPCTVTFSALPSTDADGDLPLQYLWDTGSGATPWLSEAQQTVTYTVPGTYTAFARVRDAWWTESDATPASASVVVTPPPKPIPQACIVVPPTTFPFRVFTVDASCTVCDRPQCRFSFDFGLGFTPYQLTPTKNYAYAKPGVRTVTVQVQNQTGGTATATGTTHTIWKVGEPN